MWRRIANAVLWICVIIGILMVIGFGFEVATEDSGIGVFFSLIGIIVVLVSASGFGLFIEMAKNLEKIERSISELKGRTTGMPGWNVGMEVEKQEVEKSSPILAETAVRYTWKCEKCGQDNDFSADFCPFCGTKRNKNEG